MDKLTPGQLRDLVSLITEYENPTSNYKSMGHLLMTEAARREGEVKPEDRVYHWNEEILTHAEAVKRGIVNTEREGLGSAACEHEWQQRGPMHSPVCVKCDAFQDNLVEPPSAFRLEVGKSYARRDGTGPVKILSYYEGLAYPFYDTCGFTYKRDGGVGRNLPNHPHDLVALWQAEAQAPQTDADDLVQRCNEWLTRLTKDMRVIDANNLLALCVVRIEMQADKIEGLDSDLSFAHERLREVAAERDALKARLDEALKAGHAHREAWIQATEGGRAAVEKWLASQDRVADAEHMCAIATADYANEKARANKNEARVAELEATIAKFSQAPYLTVHRDFVKPGYFKPGIAYSEGDKTNG